MTSVKIINDDVGLRGLQESNKTPVISGPVQPVKASNPLQKSPENIPMPPIKTENKQHQSHQLNQRRHYDRRKTDTSLLLETRNRHDRRIQNIKTDQNENDKENETLHGIDEIV